MISIILPTYNSDDILENAIKSVDVVIYLVDATRPKIDMASENIMKEISNLKSTTLLVINKIDKVD